MQARRLFFPIPVLALSACLFAAAGDGGWLMKVPEKDRARANPLLGDAQAIAAGGKLFRQHCAACHGQDANGRRDRPGLRSEHVKDATPGQLQWPLTNGSMKNGMPSWSRLPEIQRWQLVTYLKSLQ